MYILHLSDLHFGNTKDANLWYSQLADDLEQLLPQIEPSHSSSLDALIISGDIANRSLPEEYDAAEQFIKSIMIDFGLKQRQVAIIPGNHDLNWQLSEDAYQPIRQNQYPEPLSEGNIVENNLIIDGSFVLVPDLTRYEQRFKNFSDFYERVIGKPYPSQSRQQYELRYFPDQSLLILGLNSAWKLNHDPQYKARASINSDALNNALREIKENPAFKNSRLKIAVWHHPLDSPDEDRIKDRDFMQRLESNNFRLALHGHIHQARIENFRHRVGKQIDVIAAGTFGAPVKEWVPGHPLQYNLLNWKGNKLTVYSRQRQTINGAWQPYAMFIDSNGMDASSFYEIELWKTNPQIEEHEPPNSSQLNNNDPIWKILFLEANPHRDLDLNREIKEVEQAIKGARDRDKFQIKLGLAVGSEDLHDLILNFEPNIVHFCGHGSGESGLVFLDKKIGTDALSNLFKLFQQHLECVVLNACFAEVQAKAIVKHIDYVIGMKQEIQDRAAKAFSLGFYRALAYGRSIEDAYEFGCSAIQIAIDERSIGGDIAAKEIRKLEVIDSISSPKIPEYLKPVLYIKSQSSKD